MVFVWPLIFLTLGFFGSCSVFCCSFFCLIACLSHEPFLLFEQSPKGFLLLPWAQLANFLLPHGFLSFVCFFWAKPKRFFRSRHEFNWLCFCLMVLPFLAHVFVVTGKILTVFLSRYELCRFYLSNDLFVWLRKPFLFVWAKPKRFHALAMSLIGFILSHGLLSVAYAPFVCLSKTQKVFILSPWV